MATIVIEGNISSFGKDTNGAKHQRMQLRQSKDGKTTFAQFTVAWSERERNTNTGQWEDTPTEFTRVTVFGWRAEALAATATIGTRVLLTGDYKHREWSSATGPQKESAMTANQAGIVPKSAGQTQPAQRQQQAPQQPAGGFPPLDDQPPF